MSIISGELSLDKLLKTKKQLDAAIKTARTELEITGAIKCFEYTYETSWKILRKVLINLGVRDINSPRTVFAAAYDNKLIDDIDIWNHYISLRNLTEYAYVQEKAMEVFAKLPDFAKHVEALINNLEH